MCYPLTVSPKLFNFGDMTFVSPNLFNFGDMAFVSPNLFNFGDITFLSLNSFNFGDLFLTLEKSRHLKKQCTQCNIWYRVNKKKPHSCRSTP